MINTFLNFIKQKQVGFPLLVALNGFFLFSCQENFKLFVIFSLISFLVYVVYTRSILLSLYVLLLVSLQFDHPGKYYIFQMISPAKYFFELLPNGVFESYGLIGSDLLAVSFILLLIKYLFTPTSEEGKSLRQIWRNPQVKVFSLLWFIYFIISFYSSSQVSFFPLYSLISLTQQGKIVVLFFATYLFFSLKKVKLFFFPILGGLILFQSLLGVQQFITGIGGVKVSTSLTHSTVSPEEDLFFSRSTGTFAYSNQFSLILAILLMLFSNSIFDQVGKKRLFNILIFFMGSMNILLSQSRFIWIIYFIYVVYFLFFVHKIRINPKQVLESFYFRLLLLLVFSGLLVVLPRLYLSHYFFSSTGGGALRIKMISDGIQVFLQVPLFGTGIGTNVYSMFQYIPYGYIYSFPFSIHFSYLQMSIESGFIAMICFFLPFYFILRNTLRKKKLPIGRRKLFFSVCWCMVAVLSFYGLHPQNSRVEFPFLGIILGTGSFLIDQFNYEKK